MDADAVDAALGWARGHDSSQVIDIPPRGAEWREREPAGSSDDCIYPAREIG